MRLLLDVRFYRCCFILALFRNYFFLVSHPASPLNVIYRVFQKFVAIVNCILRKAFNAFLGKCKLIHVRNLSK